jgi:hypothetical protein
MYLISTLNWFTIAMFSYFLILTGYQEVTKETCSSWKWSIHLTGFLHDMLSLYTIYRYIAPYCHHVFFLSRDSNYGQSFLKLELILASQCVTTIQGKLTWSILEVSMYANVQCKSSDWKTKWCNFLLVLNIY